MRSACDAGRILNPVTARTTLCGDVNLGIRIAPLPVNPAIVFDENLATFDPRLTAKPCGKRRILLKLKDETIQAL